MPALLTGGLRRILEGIDPLLAAVVAGVLGERFEGLPEQRRESGGYGSSHTIAGGTGRRWQNAIANRDKEDAN